MRLKSFIIFLTLFIMATAFTCNNSKDISVCGIKDPVKNLEWLKTRIDNAEKIEVYKMVYNEKEYISVNPCPGCPDSMTEIFDCDENRFCTIGGITGRNTCPDDFLEKSEKILILIKE